MKKRLSMCALALVAAFLCLREANGSGEALTIRITDPEGTFSEKQVTLHVSMTNISSRDITVVKSNPGCDFQADVKDALGRSPELTEAGRELARCQKRTVLGRWIVVTLKPGESTDDSYPMDLYYELQRPGSYTVRLSREIGREAGGGVAKSNEVRVVVEKS